MIIPLQWSNCSTDGDLSFNLFWVIIGGGSTVLYSTKAINGSSIEQHRFGQGGFSFATMANNANIAYFVGSIVFHQHSPYRFITVSYTHLTLPTNREV